MTGAIGPGGPGGDRATRPPRGPGRAALVGLLVGTAALGAVCTALPWVTGGVSDPALGTAHATPSGREVAPAALGLFLAAGAAGLAAALTGRIARLVAALVALACGAGITWSALAVALDPGAALTRAASGRVGRADAGALADAAATPWGWVTAALGVGIALLAVALAWYGRRWSGLSSRYERPDDGAPSADRSGAADSSAGPAEARRARRDDAVSDWDRLSRGDDPTT